MSNVPSSLKYTHSHEWVAVNADGTITVGITDHAQELLGDLVFVELPEVGKMLAAGQEACVVESVKAAADAYAPVAGVVVAVNEAVRDAPESVNQDAFTAWLFKMKPVNVEKFATDLGALLDGAAYQAVVDSEK